MLNRVRALLAAISIVIILSSTPPVSATAEDISVAPVETSPTNSDLDALLEGRDWNRLSAALFPRDAAHFDRSRPPRSSEL